MTHSKVLNSKEKIYEHNPDIGELQPGWRGKCVMDGKSDNSKEKIYEHNPDTGVTRWRYINESIDDFGWPFYGRIIKDKAGKKLLKEWFWRILTND